MFSTETVNPYNSFINSMPYFYFHGDCEDTDAEVVTKSNVLSVLNGLAPPSFCGAKPSECNINTVQAYCGDVTAEKRRRKRIAVKLV